MLDHIPNAVTKQCGRKEKCIHPEAIGGWLPATRQYFSGYKDGLQGNCKFCHNEMERERRQRPDVRLKEKERKRKPEYREEQMLRDRELRASEEYQTLKRTPEFLAAQRARANRRNLLLRTLPNDFTDKQKAACLDYWGYRCVVCGISKDVRPLVADHWIPLCKGGATTVKNMIPLCTGRDSCNQSKDDTDAEEWLRAFWGNEIADRVLSEVTTYFASVDSVAL